VPRRGEGLYLRGQTWYLDFHHKGQRHIERLGRLISRSVARELAGLARTRILRREALRQDTPVIGPPQLTLAGAALRQAKSPMVYLFIRAGHVMYVGATGRGLERPLSSQHHVLKHVPGDEHDVLIHFPVATKAAAERLEHELIRALTPEWNRQRATGDTHTPDAKEA
jgi:hypothetical protein